MAVAEVSEEALAQCRAEQEEELLVLQSIFDADCEVECEEQGQIAIALRLAVDLGVEAGCQVRVCAEVPAEDGDENGGPHLERSAVTEGRPPPAEDLSVQELAESVIRQKAQPAKVPMLERSATGNHVACPDATIRHLPPLRLHIALPPDYPTQSPPLFHLACLWLTAEQLAVLCFEMDRIAEESFGGPVIYAWAEFLREEAATLLGLGTEVKLKLSDTAPDARAVAECTDPLAALMEVVQYDQQLEMESWRQQMQQCMICFTEKPGTQHIFLGGCSHSFCKECVGEMAKVHVIEGSIVELKCPQPDCRKEISADVLEQVLDEESFDRWHRLKIEQVMSTELKGLVFCPSCEENGESSPVIAETPSGENEAPLAVCKRCHFMFCGRCLGVAHSSIDGCISAEEREFQQAMRKAGRKPPTQAEKRQLEKAAKGVAIEFKAGDTMDLRVDSMGVVLEAYDKVKQGDEIVSVGAGTRDKFTLLWKRDANAFELLETALQHPVPLVIRYRTPEAGSTAERLRKRRAFEELMSLRAIASDSKNCPKCHVRISRSQGCNHMTCTKCGEHFCYRCGQGIDGRNPYGHFGSDRCPVFDRGEVMRMNAQEHQGGGVDAELERLRNDFGNQAELYQQFQDARERNQRRAGVVARRRQANDTACPTCGHWNGRTGRLNHVRCPNCRTSYCHHCKRRIHGVVTLHYRGQEACPQHGDG